MWIYISGSFGAPPVVKAVAKISNAFEVGSIRKKRLGTPVETLMDDDVIGSKS